MVRSLVILVEPPQISEATTASLEHCIVTTCSLIISRIITLEQASYVHVMKSAPLPQSTFGCSPPIKMYGTELYFDY
jgi:hypothetical protein